MSVPDDAPLDIDLMADDELAAALLAGAVGADWSEQAAVDLLVGQRGWLGRWEFRQAVEAAICDNGQLCAWVNWDQVAMDAPASSGELRILAIARSLGGVPSPRSLADLLVGLDETNTVRVLRAVSIACQGRNTPAGGDCECGQGVLW